MTAGVVRAQRRTLPDDSAVPFIQTDVAVNPETPVSSGDLPALVALTMAGDPMKLDVWRKGLFMPARFPIPHWKPLKELSIARTRMKERKDADAYAEALGCKLEVRLVRQRAVQRIRLWRWRPCWLILTSCCNIPPSGLTGMPCRTDRASAGMESSA